jgi:hypothetical protein
MHDKEHPYGQHTQSHPASQQQGYEVSDLQIKVTLWSGVAVVIMTFIAYVVSTFVVHYSNAQAPISEFNPPPVAVEAVEQPFATGVRLQVDMPSALQDVRESQHERATTFGVVSAEPEIYRIPVETAIDIVAERGLPVFPVLAQAEGPGQAREQE